MIELRLELGDASQIYSAPAGQEDGNSIRELIAAFDWAATSLGPVQRWPISLKSMMAMVLAAEQPMLLWWGPDLVQIYNDAFRPSLGAGRHPRSLGQRAIECWQDVWAVVGDQIKDVIACGKPTLKENALVPIWRNGRMEEVYWNYTYTPVFGDDGKIAGVLTICMETTARVLAERRQQMLSRFNAEAGRQSTRADVIARAKEAALSNAADIRFVHVSAQEPKPRCWEPVATLSAPGGKGQPDLTISFGLSAQLPFDDAYRRFLMQFMKSIHDAVARAESVRKFEMARADRDRLLLDAPVGTAVLTGPELSYQLANPVYCSIIGRGEIVGRSFAEVFPELVGSNIHDILLAAYRTGVPYVSSETHVRLKIDGSEKLQDKYYSYNLAPLRDVAGGVYGLMVIAVDITPHVVARRDIERLNRDLTAASRAKDEFLAMLAHELRNPLAPISAAADLLALAPHDQARVRETSALVARQVRHMTGLIDDLLDASRVTRGLVEINTERMDARRILSDALEQVHPLIEARRHHIQVHALPRPAWIAGDHKRLVQVVANILVNAAKYTEEGGRIVAEMKLAGDKVAISVADNGIGMEPDLVARAFELFAQAKRTPDRSQGGLGIGLALVKSLVGLHGGSVAAESGGHGRGSKFTVCLPLLKEPAVAAGSAPLPAWPLRPADRLSVLIVDDNRDAAQMLAMCVEALGHEVNVEYVARDALARSKALRPQICLLDIGLPDMDGNELARCLRSQPETATSVLIAVTGYGQEQDTKQSAEAGFDYHFVKPIDTNKLASLLARIHAA
jgi:signal transduction histidine kinase